MAGTVSVNVPFEYGYVIAATTATFWLGMWHGARISSFRRPAKIGYPKAYADSGDIAAAKDAEHKKSMYLLNCARRAHGNYLENHPSVAIAMLIAGVQYPLTTTALGVGWMVFRVIYALGYTRKDKNDGSGRLYGSGFWLMQFGVWGLATWVGIKMVI